MARVLFCRHAEAVDPTTAGSDEDRWLNAAGRDALRRVAARLLELDARVTRLVSSPLVRAVQTAELLAAAHGAEGPIAVSRLLATGTAAGVVGLAADAEADGLLALVGHEPLIRHAAMHALGGERLPELRTSGACLVELGPPARLVWQLDPRADRLIQS